MRADAMAPKTGSSTSGETKKNAARVGPAPPPGRTQLTKAGDYSDQMEEDTDNDDDSDEEEDGGGTPFSNMNDEGIAGVLMDMVQEERRDVAFYAIDELVRRV